MKNIILITTILLLSTRLYSQDKNDRPNILWITCEDISPYLGCYGCKEAYTPNLDKLAEEGVRYTHAYANAPVCAVARSTILSGMYATSIGTHQMRSRMQLPESIPAYPRILREDGYYCTNNYKKDYNSNFEDDESLWDESSTTAHWKNKKKDQPFFAVFNLYVTHESQLEASKIENYVKNKDIPETPRVDPKSIVLPPYHPDLPAIRTDWARLHDLITHMDKLAGDRLQELEDAGEAENTIVFFYSDHGGMLSRAKRYIYNTGTQVPFIVHFPKKWQHLAPSAPGTVCKKMVSFVDFAKTALSLTNAEIPDKMQGQIFLGNNTESEPATVHFYRDRMVEYYDFSRAVTDGKYYYIHNFMPHRPRGRDIRYGYQVHANWRAWQEYYDAGKCNPIQSQFYQPKPVVELFDTGKDPWHVNNLAMQPEYKQTMDLLAKDLYDWMVRTKDLGVIPEPMFSELAGPNKKYKYLYDFAQSEDYPIQKLLPIAKNASWGDTKQTDNYLKYLQDDNPIARYYGAYALFLLKLDTKQVQSILNKMMLTDHFTTNRIMAAQALAVCGNPDDAYKALLKEAEATKDGYQFILALNGFRFGKLENRLTREHWEHFKEKKIGAEYDPIGYDYAQEMIIDALDIYPERRIVE